MGGSTRRYLELLKVAARNLEQFGQIILLRPAGEEHVSRIARATEEREARGEGFGQIGSFLKRPRRTCSTSASPWMVV